MGSHKIIHIEDEFLIKEDCEYIKKYFSSRKSDVECYNGNSTFILNILSTYKKDDVLRSIVNDVVKVCKGFQKNIRLDTLQIVRWPVESYMKSHIDPDSDVFAAMVYLNDDFIGGHTCFEEFEIKPEVGKLIIFSNSYYRHYVTRIESGIRYTLAFWFTSPK